MPRGRVAKKPWGSSRGKRSSFAGDEEEGLPDREKKTSPVSRRIELDSGPLGCKGGIALIEKLWVA